MKLQINHRWGRRAVVAATMLAGAAAHAAETIPTDITAASALVTTGQTTIETAASWAIFLASAVTIALIGIRYFRKSMPKA